MIDFEPLKVYRRVLRLLYPVRRLALTLTLANLALAAVPFLEPMLFGRTIDLLTQAETRGAEATLHDGIRIFGLWLLVGVGSIAVGAIVSLHADRLAHRLRLEAMPQYFAHILQLHLAYHRGAHSGRLLSIMLQGGDQVFHLWLAMFRSHLSTLVALLVLLPLTLLLNWKLALLLILLSLASASLTALSPAAPIAPKGRCRPAIPSWRSRPAMPSVMYCWSRASCARRRSCGSCAKCAIKSWRPSFRCSTGGP